MAAPEFRGLRKWEENQRGRIGSLTNMDAPDAATRQHRQKAELYNTAVRTLRRQARRGDAGAALGALNTIDRANNEGFSPGGVRNYDEFQGDSAAYKQGLRERAEDFGKANEFDRRYADEMSRRAEGVATPAPTPETQDTPMSRDELALGLLEGRRQFDPWDKGTFDRAKGTESYARSQGITDEELGNLYSGDTDLKYRQTLDRQLGKARSPEEVARLRERGSRMGIDPSAFDRRANWWSSNR